MSTIQAARPGPAVTLPTPPDDQEKYCYAGRNLPHLAISLAVSAACLIVSQIRFGLADPVLWPFLVVTGLYVAYQAISLDACRPRCWRQA